MGQAGAEEAGARKPSCPVLIGPTSQRRHLTGGFALNIPNWPLLHGGDWHQWHTWFARDPEAVRDSGFTNEDEYAPLLNRLGRWGLRDARNGLKHLDHPQAAADTTIWAATYERAALELAWRELAVHGPQSLHGAAPPIDAHELARWLPYPHQWARLHWYASRLRRDLRGEKLRDWDEWRRTWNPWA